MNDVSRFLAQVRDGQRQLGDLDDWASDGRVALSFDQNDGVTAILWAQHPDPEESDFTIPGAIELSEVFYHTDTWQQLARNSTLEEGPIEAILDRSQVAGNPVITGTSTSSTPLGMVLGATRRCGPEFDVLILGGRPIKVPVTGYVIVVELLRGGPP